LCLTITNSCANAQKQKIRHKNHPKQSYIIVVIILNAFIGLLPPKGGQVAVLIYFVSYNCYYVKLRTSPTLFAIATANALRTIIILLNRRKTSIILLLVENPRISDLFFN